jgi:uncharacterized ferritin-like protein (DUF455 family)
MPSLVRGAARVLRVRSPLARAEAAQRLVVVENDPGTSRRGGDAHVLADWDWDTPESLETSLSDALVDVDLPASAVVFESAKVRENQDPQKRRWASREGGKQVPRVAVLLHSLAHIEQNALRLFLDTVVRFAPKRADPDYLLPDEFFLDFASVAADEARHFEQLCGRLEDEYGVSYGSVPVVSSLWERSGHATRHDAVARIVAASLVEEGRALDAHEKLRERVQMDGDKSSAAVVDQICREEVGHVAVGVKWFEHLCRVRNHDPRSTFRQTVRDLSLTVTPPHNDERRESVGLPRDWYHNL